MARARNIKPGFFRNADLVDLPFETRLLFIGLWTLADRAGRLEDRPKQIKMEVFPADNVDCDSMLEDLATIDAIDRYEVAGKRFIQVTNFQRHQNPHRDEKASSIPDRDGNIDSDRTKPEKHSASTVQAQCEDDTNTVAIGLIPDSLLLIPDPMTKEEPSGSCRLASPPDQQAACPQDEIIALYHEKLPELPAVKLKTESRAKAMRGFWKWVLTSKKSNGQPRATGKDQALTWIASYFERANGNDFLMGRQPSGRGHENWRADFDFLLTEKGKKHVIEKTEATA